jgi:hypothetical protein
VDDAPNFLSAEDLAAIRAIAKMDTNEDPVRAFHPLVVEDECSIPGGDQTAREFQAEHQAW